MSSSGVPESDPSFQVLTYLLQTQLFGMPLIQKDVVRRSQVCIQEVCIRARLTRDFETVRELPDNRRMSSQSEVHTLEKVLVL